VQVQQEAAKMISNLRHETCEERLSKMSFFSLAEWPLRGEVGLNSSLLVSKRRLLRRRYFQGLD